MPAPTVAQIEAALTQSYLQQGFLKQVKDPDTGKLVPVSPPTLPEAKAREVKALALGVSTFWIAWQAATVVQIPVTSTEGSPSTGIII